MLQLSDFCLTAIQLPALKLQRSISLYFAILFPNQTHTSLDGAVRVVVLRIVGPAASVHLTTYQIQFVLYIIAFVGQLIEMDALQGRCSNRRWSNVYANIAMSQCAPFLWFLAIDGKLQAVFVSASNVLSKNNQFSKAVNTTFEGISSIVVLFAAKVDGKFYDVCKLTKSSICLVSNVSFFQIDGKASEVPLMIATAE